MLTIISLICLLQVSKISTTTFSQYKCPSKHRYTVDCLYLSIKQQDSVYTSLRVSFILLLRSFHNSEPCLDMTHMSTTFHIACDSRSSSEDAAATLERNFSIPSSCLANSTPSRLAAKQLLTFLPVVTVWAQLHNKVLTFQEIIPVFIQHP